jgi:TRAP-type transport system periplasmic protein
VTRVSRRAFVGGVLGAAAICRRPLRAAAFAPGRAEAIAQAGPPQRRSTERSRAEYTFTQLHNQTAASSLHQRLVQMWAAIRTETSGRVDAQVLAENNKIQGSDPAALKMLIDGEIQFFTLMGGILGTVVPAAEVQQVPFAFRSATHAHQAMDGALGAYLREEIAAKGLVGFPVGAFDNGMRQITSTKRPISAPADLAGLRMRVPAGQLVADTFRALGAEPVTINSNAIYEALKSGTVDAQENPLALVDLFKLYEVVKYVSMTSHMWSGFNLLANQSAWMRLPGDLKAIIDRNVRTHVRLQRQDQERMNTGLRADLARRGLVFNTPDAAPFRRQLSGVYAAWKDRLGSKCWTLLQQAIV